MTSTTGRSARRTGRRREARRGEILVLGDSLAKLGVVPRAIEERTGRRTFNLALSGGQATTSLAVFRQAPSAGARPEAVVVDFFPTLQTVGPRHTLGRWASLLGPAEAAELAWNARDGGLFGSIVLARLLPTFQGRAVIRDHVKAALDGRPTGDRWANTLMRRNWARNAGAHLLPAAAGGVRLTDAEAEAWRVRQFLYFRVEPVNARRSSGSSRSRPSGGCGCSAPAPVPPGASARLRGSGFDAAHRAFVRSWQERFPGLTVIDGGNAVSDPLAFFDPHHLAAAGAYGFSLALGETLRHALAAEPGADPRRVVMPACAPRPVPPGLEDIDASKLALERYRDRTRR